MRGSWLRGQRWSGIPTKLTRGWRVVARPLLSGTMPGGKITPGGRMMPGGKTTPGGRMTPGGRIGAGTVGAGLLPDGGIGIPLSGC